MWLLAEWMSNGMFLAGIVLLILIMFRRSYRHHLARNRRSSGPVPRRMQIQAADRALSETPDDVMKWQVEMHELARTLKAELDTKMRLVQLLIGQARVESDRLEQLLSVLDPSRIAAGETGDADRVAVSGDLHPQQSAIYALADSGHSPQEIAARLEAPLGEVELLLSLRPAVSASDGPSAE
jgi:DNA-directed RNA polymerase specialized sigma24 family protein